MKAIYANPGEWFDKSGQNFVYGLPSARPIPTGHPRTIDETSTTDDSFTDDDSTFVEACSSVDHNPAIKHPADMATMWKFAKHYTRELVITGLDSAIPHDLRVALVHFQHLKSLKLEFVSFRSMMCSSRLLGALREHFSNFEVQITGETTTVTLAFAESPQGPNKAELQLIAADVQDRTYFKTFGISDSDWDKAQTLFCNGTLHIGGSKTLPNITTLRLDRTAQIQRVGLRHYRSPDHLQELNSWFPNLKHFELEFLDDDGRETPDGKGCFMDSLASFQNLKYLSFKSIPTFIDGILVRGKIYNPQEGRIRGRWHRGCHDMCDGYDRINTYATRAVQVTSNICEILLKKKKGVPFSKVGLTIEPWSCATRSTEKASHHNLHTKWAIKCVPQVSCVWIDGELEPKTEKPKVQVNVTKGDNPCGKCAPRLRVVNETVVEEFFEA